MPQSDAWASIRAAFETRLSTLSGTHETAYMNQSYTPTKGTTWVRGSLLPAQTQAASIGLDGNDLYQGIFQVDVFVPQGKGSGEGVRLADDVIEHFPKSTVLTSGVFRIRIENSWITTPREEPDWFMIPVSVSWFSHGNN